MAEAREDDSVAPRRSLGGPILPPPPPGLAQEADQAQGGKAAERRAAAEKKPAAETTRQKRADRERGKPSRTDTAEQPRIEKKPAGAARNGRSRRPRPVEAAEAKTNGARTESATKQSSPRRTRRAQLRLVQVDAWSVMKTSFLLSIALGIVLVVAVAIIWAVLGASGVWDAVNSVVQQAVGGSGGDPFRIEDYVGTSRVLGFTMIVAVIDVVLITAIATLGAFLYNLSAALLGGIEVTLAEDN